MDQLLINVLERPRGESRSISVAFSFTLLFAAALRTTNKASVNPLFFSRNRFGSLISECGSFCSPLGH